MHGSSTSSPPRVDARPQWALHQPITLAGPLASLRAVVLLSGSVWPLPWQTQIGRAVLDLPLEPGLSLLGHWVRQVNALAQTIGATELPLRVVLCRAAPIPSANPAWTGALVRVQVQRDAMDYRGTGGVLRDLADDYQPDDYLLVASAAQVLLENLESLARALARTGGDIALLVEPDGSPGNVMLVRCGLLRQISPVGFVDFKEQALPGLARRHRVKVLHRPHPAAAPVLTHADYLAAVRQYRLHHAGAAMNPGTGFGIVEPGAQVDDRALLYESVVLLGAHVGPGAVLVRSIVCEEAEVPHGTVAIDRVIKRHGLHAGHHHRRALAGMPLTRLTGGWSPPQ